MDIQQSQAPMPPKNLIYLCIGVLIVLLVAGLCWYFYGSEKAEPGAVSDALENEEKSLDEDMAELESFSADKSLDTLEQDLTAAAGEQVIIETASVENLEKELSDELNSLANDITSLENLNNDTSLDNLDSGLMSAGQ